MAASPDELTIIGQVPGWQWYHDNDQVHDTAIVTYDSLEACPTETLSASTAGNSDSAPDLESAPEPGPEPAPASSAPTRAVVLQLLPSVDVPADTVADSSDAVQDSPASRGTADSSANADSNVDQPRSTALTTCLGEAVRRFPERLIICVEADQPDDAAFFAFGFRRLQLAEASSIRLYEYCLSEYKQAPAWLNSRYWAHPERFGMDNESDYESEDDDDEEE